MGTTWKRQLEMLGSLFRKAGPYVALELLLPGGTLFALALFLYQRRDDAVVKRRFRMLRRWMEGALALITPPAPVRASVRSFARMRATV
jgi:hypothetical protein